MSSSRKNDITQQKSSKIRSGDPKIHTKAEEKENKKLSAKKQEQHNGSSRTKSVDKNLSSRSIQSSTKSKVNVTAAKSVQKAVGIKSSAQKSSSKKPNTTESLKTRVIKTQYFPSKQMISNAVKSKKQETEKEKNSIKDHDSQSDNSTSERPKTATLEKGKLVNKNIVGPDCADVSKTSETDSEKNNDENEYEEDFESYESDFEEYNSSSTNSLTDINSDDLSSSTCELTENNEDKQLDSGNFEIAELKYKHKLDDIKETVEQDNTVVSVQHDSRSNLGSLSDEGFEEGKSLQSVPFFNFSDAKKKLQEVEKRKKKQRRGEELLSMIKLDAQNFTVLDMPCVPYENFIKMYGNQNTLQTGTQTGEDKSDEEVQTEYIFSGNKWTQFPSVISRGGLNDFELYKKDYLGVGCDNVHENKKDVMIFNEKHLNNIRIENFFANVSPVVMTILEEKAQFLLNDINNSENIPFSKGYVTYNTNLEYLSRNCIVYISFSSNADHFLTVHSNKENKNYDTALLSLICIWNVSECNRPESIFASYGDLCCACFGINNLNLIFAGSTDGLLMVWDKSTSEQSNNFNLNNIHSYMPNFITEVNLAHTSKVVKIEPFEDSNEENMSGMYINKKGIRQVCSLEEEGVIIIWGVILKSTDFNTLNNISLVQNLRVNLQELQPDLNEIECTDMVINRFNNKHILISTNFGSTSHILVFGTKANPSKYVAETSFKANCISSCPFSADYFLTGHEDGNVFLYSRLINKSLKKLSNQYDDNGNSSIQSIEWSSNRPFIFYTRDSSNYIHTWNLEISDIFPISSVYMKEKIHFIKLSPPNFGKNIKKSYMIILTNNNVLNLHVLNEEHGQILLDKYNDDINKFKNYVNRL